MFLLTYQYPYLQQVFHSLWNGALWALISHIAIESGNSQSLLLGESDMPQCSKGMCACLITPYILPYV